MTLSQTEQNFERLAREIEPHGRLLRWWALTGGISAGMTALEIQLPDGQARRLHGDFWPGNVLWQDGRLAAVIDWEDACCSDPPSDLAISRLDLLWIWGLEAMDTFSADYLARTAIDTTHLPYWDLWAALRLAHLAGARRNGYLTQAQTGQRDLVQAAILQIDPAHIGHEPISAGMRDSFLNEVQVAPIRRPVHLGEETISNSCFRPLLIGRPLLRAINRIHHQAGIIHGIAHGLDKGALGVVRIAQQHLGLPLPIRRCGEKYTTGHQFWRWHGTGR